MSHFPPYINNQHILRFAICIFNKRTSQCLLYSKRKGAHGAAFSRRRTGRRSEKGRALARELAARYGFTQTLLELTNP